MVTGRGIVNTDVHLPGVVIKINARHIVRIVVIVRRLAAPLNLCALLVPTNTPFVDLVVGVVGRVDVSVVDIGVVNAVHGV